MDKIVQFNKGDMDVIIQLRIGWQTSMSRSPRLGRIGDCLDDPRW
jgi:hypothetical protein